MSKSRTKSEDVISPEEIENIYRTGGLTSDARTFMEQEGIETGYSEWADKIYNLKVQLHEHGDQYKETMTLVQKLLWNITHPEEAYSGIRSIFDKNFRYNRLKNDKTAIGRLYKQAYEFAKRTQKDAQELMNQSRSLRHGNEKRRATIHNRMIQLATAVKVNQQKINELTEELVGYEESRNKVMEYCEHRLFMTIERNELVNPDPSLPFQDTDADSKIDELLKRIEERAETTLTDEFVKEEKAEITDEIKEKQWEAWAAYQQIDFNYKKKKNEIEIAKNDDLKVQPLLKAAKESAVFHDKVLIPYTILNEGLFEIQSATWDAEMEFTLPSAYALAQLVTLQEKSSNFYEQLFDLRRVNQHLIDAVVVGTETALARTEKAFTQAIWDPEEMASAYNEYNRLSEEKDALKEHAREATLKIEDYRKMIKIDDSPDTTSILEEIARDAGMEKEEEK